MASERTRSESVTSNARAMRWAGWGCVAAVAVALATMTAYFYDARPAFAPTRVWSPPLLAAQIALPVLGAPAPLALIRAGALRAGARMGAPVFAWMAAGWLFLLLASLSGSNHSWISWGEGFAIADVTGVGQPGPAYQEIMMLAPAVTIPLLIAPVMLCLNEWSGERVARPQPNEYVV